MCIYIKVTSLKILESSIIVGLLSVVAAVVLEF